MVKKFLIICVLGFLLYAPTLKAPFVFDEHPLILHNHLTQGLDHGLEGLRGIWSFQPSRFLTNLTLAINYYFHEFDVFGYHLVNVLIHLLTVFGVWYFTRLMLHLIGESNLKVDIPFWAALLFLVHTVNTGSVSYIGQRCSSLMSLFYVWSVICYIQARTSVHHQKKILYFVCTFGLASLAVLSKEPAITLPLAWLLIDYFIIRRPSPRWILAGMILIVLMVMACFDFGWQGFFSNGIISSQSHDGDQLTIGTYLLTQLRVLVVFFKLIFIPVGLNIDYDFAMSKSLFEPVVLLSLIFLLSLLYLAFKVQKTCWYVSFGIFWFFISFLSHIFPVRANVIAEQKLYLTLSLLAPVLTYGLYKVVSSRVFILWMVLLVGILSFLTFERNILWSHPELIWKDCLSKSPHKTRPHINLAGGYLLNDKYDEALFYFQKAIEMSPGAFHPYLNIAQIYFDQHNIPKAMEYSQKAIDVAPNVFLPYLERGILFMQQQKFIEAVADFTKSLTINPNQWGTYKIRGVAYERLYYDTDALRDFQFWLSKNPKDTMVLKLMADIHMRHKEYDLALQDCNKLIELNPIGVFYHNRSLIYQILGDQAHMIQDQQKAKELGFYEPARISN